MSCSRDKNLGQTPLNRATFLDATEKSHIEDQNPTSQRVFFQQPDAIPETPHCQRDVSTRIQGEIARWHCAARREIAERSEEAPAAEAAQPSRNYGEWKALGGQPVELEVYDKPSGVVWGECRHPNKKMPRPTCYKGRLSHTSESNFSAKLAAIIKNDAFVF